MLDPEDGTELVRYTDAVTEAFRAYQSVLGQFLGYIGNS
jgi:hypothetical protein